MSEPAAISAPAPIDVTQHRGLVHWVIKRRGLDRRIARSSNLSVDDLEQAGMIGLMKAAERFDPGRGCTFGTYAALWVRHVIERLIEEEACTVRTPCFLQARRRKAGEPMRAHVSRLDRSTGHRHGTIGIDEGRTFLDMLAAPEPEDTRECLPAGTSLESLIAATPALSANEAFVLRGRAQGKALSDLGAELDLSRERARQLELEAVAKIREAQGLEIRDDLAERHARVRRHNRGRAA